MTGGLITLRFALAIRPRPGFRLGLAAATAAVVGAALLLLRDRLSGLVDPDVLIGLLGISAVLTGLLRVLGGFAAEERLGRRWTLGGIALGTLEVALGTLLLLTSDVDPALLAPIAAAWGAVSGTLLLAQVLLVGEAREEGLDITGDGGLLQKMMKSVLEAALTEELTDHLGGRPSSKSARRSSSISQTSPKSPPTSRSLDPRAPGSTQSPAYPYNPTFPARHFRRAVCEGSTSSGRVCSQVPDDRHLMRD